MPYNQYEEIRNLIWQEEKKYLMKKVAFDLILNHALKIGDYILFSGKLFMHIYRKTAYKPPNHEKELFYLYCYHFPLCLM